MPATPSSQSTLRQETSTGHASPLRRRPQEQIRPVGKGLAGVAFQVLQASAIHKHPATLNTPGLHLYQVAVGCSITPFASSRAREGTAFPGSWSPR